MGEHYTPAYQLSSIPYVTSSMISNGIIHKYEFQFITRFIGVENMGEATNKICIGFSENGLKPAVGNFITLDSKSSLKEEIRTTSLFVSCSSGMDVKYQLFCGLTMIPAKNFLVLTGSNGYQGIG